MKDCLRVLYVAHYVELYGANRSLLELLYQRKLAGQYSVVVVPEMGELTDILESEGIDYHVMPLKFMFHIHSQRRNKLIVFARWVINRTKAIRNSVLNRMVARSVESVAKDCQIDIIHTNSLLTPVGMYASISLGVPHVWHIREFCDLDYFFQPDWGKKRVRQLLAKSAKVICISDAIRKHHCEGMLGVDIVYNGVMSVDVAEGLAHRPQGSFSCLIIGYLSETKGQLEAIEAVGILLDKGYEIDLFVVGDGNEEYSDMLRDYVESNKLEEYVHFVGKVTTPLDYFQKCELTLMCSKNEGMGRVTPEAMFSGSVVVGYDNAGTSELIQDGETGLLYRNGVVELADKIEELYKNDEYRDLLREKAKDYAYENFTSEAYGHEIGECYRKLLS